MFSVMQKADQIIGGGMGGGTTPSNSPLHRGRVEYYAGWGLGREERGTGVGD